MVYIHKYIQLFAKRASYTVDDIGLGTGKMITDLNGSLGSDNFTTLQIKGHVLHCACAHLKVPGCSLV